VGLKKGIWGFLVFSLLVFFSVSIVSAECPIKISAKTTSALLSEVPSIDSQLKSCSTEVPSELKKLITNGVFLLEITDNDDVYIDITEGIITGVRIGTEGKYDYRATVSSCNLDVILSKENGMGAFAAYYLSGKANLGASGFINKIKLFFGKMFARGALRNIQVPVEDCVASSDIPTYNGFNVCEFYQAPLVTKKLVTCTAYKAGDSFCVNSMGSKDARALKCDDTGLVICGIPCGKSAPSMCAADINRKRGNNAAPISFCNNQGVVGTTTNSGEKPSNCYETYMQGHSEYQYAKAQWDAWLAETGNICQTQTSEKPNGDCKYLYEQIKGNDKKWLCWY